MPSAHRSEEYVNSPLTFSTPSGRMGLSPILPGDEVGGEGRSRVGVVSADLIRGPPLSRSYGPDRREAHGVHNLLVAGTAAEVAGEGLPDLRVGRPGVAPEQ